MEKYLKLIPTQRKEGMKYKSILITDIALHIQKRPTTSLGSKIRKSFETDKPGRIYTPMIRSSELSEEKGAEEGFKFILDMFSKDPDFIEYVEEERKKGFEVTLQIPKSGIPIFMGDDTNEFINSKHGQRLLRRLAKNKEEII